jgi:hypothetical protein
VLRATAASALAAAACASQAHAAAVSFDPAVAGQGTTFLIAPDPPLLAPDGQPARSLTVALPRGIQVDTAARSQLCDRAAALRAACPDTSRIGFGRFGLSVSGYDLTNSATEITWAVAAYLGPPKERGDTASVVLTSSLLGSDLVNALLTPIIGGQIAAATTTFGRLVRRSSGRFELRFDGLPASLTPVLPALVKPSRFELSLGAVRRVRQNFQRRFRIKTESGEEVRKVADHRLVGHYLLRAPRRCSGTWASEVRVDGAGGVKRTRIAVPCTAQ